MVCAMFLTKNLLQDWRIGEKHFAQHLVDYDPCSNNGGWQWSSSTGADGSPYFRIMNPQSQLIKVDPQLLYVRRYVPELGPVTERSDVHKWEEKKVHEKYTKGIIPETKKKVKENKQQPKTIDLAKFMTSNKGAASSSSANSAAGASGAATTSASTTKF